MLLDLADRGHLESRARSLSVRRLRFAFTLGALLPLAGCLPDLGECDFGQATELVFQDDLASCASLDNGRPMYAGQALVMSSCGNGEYCHASAINADARLGAPVSLDLDVGLACAGHSCGLAPTAQERERDAAAVARLRANQRAVVEHARLILDSVRDGRMPIGGAGSASVRKPPGFRRVPYADPTLDTVELRWRRDPTYTTPLDSCFLTVEDMPTDVRSHFTSWPLLPDVGSHEGTEILRNWLACGAPVLESTSEPFSGPLPGESCMTSDDANGHVGLCLAGVDPPIVTPQATWTSIYELVIQPLCGERCHNPRDATHFRDSGLDLSDRMLARDSLLARRSTSVCENHGWFDGTGNLVKWVLVDVGSPDQSLLIHKLTDDWESFPTDGRCGDPMGHLPDYVIDPIRDWITAGAPDN